MARNYSSVAEPKTLNGNVTSVATQITLNNVDGLPAPPYVLVLNPDTANEEVVLVNADQSGVTSPTLKVTRAIETGATAKTHTSTNIVKHMIVGSDLQLVHNHIDNTSAHDATGGVVGVTKSQTLTNKTINLTNNAVSGTKAQFNAALSDADFTTLTGTETLTNKTLTSPVITGGTVNGGVALTVDSTELNILDGVTASTAELNILDGATLTTTELNYVDGVTSPIQTQLTNNTPVGVVNMWVTGTAPSGWLLCQGQAVSRSTYSALFSVLGTTYGAGDTSTTFNLPDLRGRVPMGAGTGRNVADSANLTARTLGAKVSDTESTTLTSSHIPEHAHTINHGHGNTLGVSGDGAHSHSVGLKDAASEASSKLLAGASGTSGIFLNRPVVTGAGTGTSTDGHSHNISGGVTDHSGSSGNYGTASPTAVNAIQPSTVINFIIKH